jgi:hypothetical protein
MIEFCTGRYLWDQIKMWRSQSCDGATNIIKDACSTPLLSSTANVVSSSGAASVTNYDCGTSDVNHNPSATGNGHGGAGTDHDNSNDTDHGSIMFDMSKDGISFRGAATGPVDNISVPNESK